MAGLHGFGDALAPLGAYNALLLVGGSCGPAELLGDRLRREGHRSEQDGPGLRHGGYMKVELGDNSVHGNSFRLR
jgi:hypothetical protein